MFFTIRLARPDDAQHLARMNNAFNGDTGVTADDVRHSLASSPEIVLIALADGSPVGFCCAQVHHSFCYPAPVAEVTEMYVEEAFRGHGCAGEMLSFLEDHLRSIYGVDELHLLTGMDNHSALATYQRAGFLPHPELYLAKAMK